MEYVIRCSQTLLYEFITSPSGLSEWFADDVNIRDGIYTFIWDGSQQQARLLALKEDAFVRYQWVDKADGSYFEFRIQIDELTGDVSLIIVDFADSDDEKESSKLLWDAQVDKLMKTIGSHG
ncbi:MAG: SRPBCC domain-containing protein [Bacteroidetes bacterium]|nr:SRPBCC domain-containing protein [Bacteroidota bacterium]